MNVSNYEFKMISSSICTLRIEFLLDWGVITIPVRNLFRQVGVAVDSWQVVNHLLEFRNVRRIASTLVLELSCIISLLLDRVH